MTISAGQFLALFSVIWPAVFIPITFGLYYGYDEENYYRQDGVHQIPTISLAGSRLPSSAILTYGLHLEAFVLVILFFAVYLEMKRRIEALKASHQLPLPERGAAESAPLFSRLVQCLTCNGFRCCCCCCSWCSCCRGSEASLRLGNALALGFGLFAALCMSIVGSIQLVANENAHGSFAFAMFLTGVVYALLFQYSLSALCSPAPAPLLLRQCCLLVCIPFNVLVIVIAGVVSLSCDNFSCRAFVVDIGPVLEFTTVFGLLLYMSSFYYELGNVNLIGFGSRAQSTHVHPGSTSEGPSLHSDKESFSI